MSAIKTKIISQTVNAQTGTGFKMTKKRGSWKGRFTFYIFIFKKKLFKQWYNNSIMSTENGGILSCYQIYGYVFEICFSHLTTNIG